MQVLIKEDNTLSIKSLPKPSINLPDDLLIQVVYAGICRTDIYVAQGNIPAHNPIIIGHEFSGIITEIGSAVTNLKIGDRVTVMPAIPCNNCPQCQSKSFLTCQHTSMLGVDRDGAFAEYIVVPQSVVYPLPSSISFQLGAYIEPIAAAIAVLKADIKPSERGLIYGENRISTLIKMILQAYQFQDISSYDPDNISQPLVDHNYDFIIETRATTETLREMLTAIRPEGKIILKSRQYQSIDLDLITAIKKEVTIKAVNYGPFSQAIELAASNRLDTDQLFGATYQLADYQRAFQTAISSESKKIFFSFEQ